MEKLVKKEDVNQRILVILLFTFGFLLLAYFAGNIEWMSGMHLLVDLLASMIAFFVGILALLRYYTKKSSLRCLFLGLGFITVGIIEIIQLAISMESFTDLFNSGYAELFPSTVVISRVFLSFIFFSSWFFMQEKYREDTKKEKLVFLGVVLLLSVTIAMVSIYTQIFSNYQSYEFAIIGQTIALVMYGAALVGYVRSKGLFYKDLDFWIIFSLTFGIISQVFFLPYLNIEYDIMLNVATLAKLLSYIIMLGGFLVNIYDMYKAQEEYRYQLEKKNVTLSATKKKVEEAYMLLRDEKWKLTKEKEKNTADKILKDILKN